MRTAPLAQRLLARIVDGVILLAVGWVIGDAIFDFSFTWLVLQLLLTFGYFIAFDVTSGATPGKRLCGIRVVGPDGSLPTLNQAATREAFTALGVIPYVGGLLALAAWIAIGVTANNDPNGQGLHDHLAGGTRSTTAP